MNIYQFAMQMEKDGEGYYRQLAESSGQAGLRKIFTMLADEEVKHYNVVDRLSRKQEAPQSAETAILENVKNVFAAMRDEKQPLLIDTTEATQAYLKACDIEQASVTFYLEKADLVGGEKERQIFLRLSEEEKKHLLIMENIVEFVSRPEPGNWLENAEWHHLDEY